MTVIAALVDERVGRVHMASDSVAERSSGLTLPKTKIHVLPIGLDDHALIGFAGAAACGPLVLANLKLEASPDPGRDADRWAQATATAVTEILIEHGRVDRDVERDFDGYALLAWRAQLWFVTTHLAVPVERYEAIGSGEQVATGAMWALADTQPPEFVVRAGVQAAIDHVAGIGGPVQQAST